MVSQRASEQTFRGTAGLLFITSAALAVIWCRSMPEMGFMPMPGGWTMSMTWMRMPGQTWAEAAASFLGMWLVMMIAMMLPSVVFMLKRYRRIVGQTDQARLGRLSAIVAAAYFVVWTLLGVIVYALGSVLAEIEMRHSMLASTVPVLAAICVLVAGALQLTAWKAHHLACCRLAPKPETLEADVSTAWWQGLCLGFHCSCCCLNLTVILLVLGVMDVRTMAVVTAAITLERLAPAGDAVSRITGGFAMALGLLLFLRAVDLV